MDRGPAIGVVFVTTAAGACAGIAVADFLIHRLQIPNREGASGYFAVFVTGMGIAGGFLVGLVTALVARSGFLQAQGYALGGVAVLAIAGAVLPIVLDDEGPTLNGEKLVAEVELKCPPGWKPDNNAKSRGGGFCWVQFQAADGPLEQNPIVSGGLTMDAPATGGAFVLRCAIDLTRTTRHRYMRVFSGNQTDVTIPLPFPAHPRPADREWTAWTSTGFLPQKDRPVPRDYAFRCRVRSDAEYKRDHPDPAEAQREAREKAVAAMPAGAPVADWLRFFEDDAAKPLPFPSGTNPQVEFVKAHAAELGPLLRSSDGTVVRQAVFAAATLDPVPPSLVAPLAVAGRHVIQLLHAAHDGALPGDPDLLAEQHAYNFFFYWDQAMAHTGDAGTRDRLAVLREIEPEVGDSRKFSDTRLIADQIAKDLESLNAPAR